MKSIVTKLVIYKKDPRFYYCPTPYYCEGHFVGGGQFCSYCGITETQAQEKEIENTFIGDDAMREYWTIKFNNLQEQDRKLILSAFPDIESKDKITLKDPQELYAITDYVTVSSSGDTNNVAVLSCKKAFGEQILLKAISAADNTKSATVTVDYRQKITNATLHFGDLSVDSGKTLHPEFDLRVWEKGDGGAVSLTYETSDYTIADTFTIDWSNKKGSSLDVGAVGVMNGKVVSEEFLMDVELGEDIYFDLSFFDFPLITEFYINSVAYTSLQAKQNNPFAIRAISYFFKSCKDCGSTDPLAVASLSVPIKSNYSTYTATFSIDFVNYVSGETAVSSVSTNESGVIY